MTGDIALVPRFYRSHIEQKASELGKLYTKSWEGKEPVPVDIIFDDIESILGIKTMYTDLSGLGLSVLGYTNGTQKVSMIHSAVSDDFSVKGRRVFRSTVGHEIGHCALHVNLDHWRKSLQVAGIGLYRSKQGIMAVDDPEWQAWCFCKALCMPAHLVFKVVKEYGIEANGIAALQQIFDMNYSFVLSRLRSLKILPPVRANSQGVNNVRNPR